MGAAAGRQAKEVDQDEIEERLASSAGREQAADGTGHEAEAAAIRDRLNQVLGWGKSDPRQEQQRKLEKGAKRSDSSSWTGTANVTGIWMGA